MSSLYVRLCILSNVLRLEPIRGAPYAPPAAIENVGVDHGCRNVLVAEKLLHRANVVAVFEQVSGERVSKGVTRYPLGQLGTPHSRLESSANRRLMEVMSVDHA